MAEQKPRKRVTDLKVHEISLVDNPAVPKARFLIVKRHEEGGDTVNLEGKDNPGDEKVVTTAPADVAEEVTKQQMKAMKVARDMLTALMGKRGDLPPFFRRQVMEMDIAVDEFMKEREAFLTRRADGDEGNDAVEKSGDEETTEVKAEETTEVEKAEETPAEKTEETPEVKAEETIEEKGKQKKCPPFMELDPETGKCVPKKKKSEKAEETAEKAEETTDESAPRDGGGGDALKEAGTLELSAAQKKRVNKLLEKFKK